jgi:hypothetical protein
MNTNRKQQALRVRIAAAKLAADRVHPRHQANGDEQKFRRGKKREGNEPSYLTSFTKGLPHDYKTGLVSRSEDFQQFVRGIDSGDPRDFKDTPLGSDGEWRSERGRNKNKVRAWESQGAGNTFDLEGPDAQAVTMPPAPRLGSDELTAEMAEVYAQALLRDVPFSELVTLGNSWVPPEPKPDEDDHDSDVEQVKSDGKDEEKHMVHQILDHLHNLKWMNRQGCLTLSPAEKSRRRKVNPETGQLDGQTVFRGITPGDEVGPYISQFLLAGNKGLGDAHAPEEGQVAYGSINISQKVRKVLECDYMTTWDEWFDVQNGADLRGDEEYDKEGEKPTYRFITTPRDLATYVHYDALYEAYLNACLIMLGNKVPFDPGIPFQGPDQCDHQQGFAHFGGPHILSLVTEVATRALKAVRYQKFNVHRRMRPEVLAARLSLHEKLCVKELNDMVEAPGLAEILNLVEKNNKHDRQLECLGGKNYLLPMAFPEGSPMHPSYGAGHATVAGACVTILKAFFDHNHPVTVAGDDGHAFVPCDDGSRLECVEVENGRLTVEGELNKLASNISIGRDWAGVHYFSDYIESLRMGEKIAISILEEQKLTYGENFSMTVPLFDGGSVRI